MNPRTFLPLAVVLVSLLPRPASAQSTPDSEPRAPLTLQPLPPTDSGRLDAPVALRDVREEAPRHAFVESPFNLPARTMFAGAVAQGTTQAGTQTGEGGLRVGGSPLDGLVFHGLVARDAAGKWAPTITAHYRLLGSLEKGAALGVLAQYKTEGFTEAGGEAELGLTGGLRSRGFVLDMNLIAGVGVEESAMSATVEPNIASARVEDVSRRL